MGLLLDEFLDTYLMNPYVVAAMLIIYGILFIVLEKHNEYVDFPIKKVSQISYLNAFYIGLFQLLALIPGTSRSGATILGAMLLGCSRTASAEFTFFLGIPVMFGASLLKVIHYGLNFPAIEIFYLIAGMVIAFVVSMYSIKFLMGYVKRHDFRFFGYYRIILGIIVMVYFGAVGLVSRINSIKMSLSCAFFIFHISVRDLSHFSHNSLIDYASERRKKDLTQS